MHPFQINILIQLLISWIGRNNQQDSTL